MPKGFRASGVASGIKDDNKLDLGLIISDLITIPDKIYGNRM